MQTHVQELSSKSRAMQVVETIPPLNNAENTRRLLGGIGATSLYKFTAAGRLKAVRLGRRTMWTAESILDVIQNGAP